MKITCPHCKYEFESTLRSNDANAYFHLMIGIRCKHNGTTFEEEKCALKIEHGMYYEKEINGKMRTIYHETSKMDTSTMSEFIENVWMQSNSEGINIMSPAEWKEKNKKQLTT